MLPPGGHTPGRSSAQWYPQAHQNWPHAQMPGNMDPAQMHGMPGNSPPFPPMGMNMNMGMPGVPPMGNPNYGMYPPPGMGMYPPYNEGCCVSCCGPSDGSCGPSDGSGCCPLPGQPPDPYCCAPDTPDKQPCCSFLTSICDFTFILIIACAIGTIIGFGVILGTSNTDNIFKKFSVQTTRDLATKIQPFIVISSNKTNEGIPCTKCNLLGSFGSICMEDNLNANTLATQFSAWNNARTTLWLVAILLSLAALLYSIIIHCARKPAPFDLAMMQQLQHQAMRKNKGDDGVTSIPMSVEYPSPMGSDAIRVFGTPLYEFIRISWFVMGVVTLAWTINVLISFLAFSNFYHDHTIGPLRDFLDSYTKKFVPSIIVVTIYLAWPIFNIFLDFVVWIFGILPWLIVRCTCFSGIEYYRPDLPLQDMPGWIRTDMFFMDFADIKRLGFSRESWLILTGSSRPMLDFCPDPTIDRDPTMAGLIQRQFQWKQQMMQMGPWGMRPGMPGFPMVNTMPMDSRSAKNKSPSRTHRDDEMHRDDNRSELDRDTRRKRYNDPSGSKANDADPNSKRHHRSRHRSHSLAEPEEADPERRLKKNDSMNASTVRQELTYPPQADGAVPNNGESPEKSKRRHHRSSKSRTRDENNPRSHHRKHRNSTQAGAAGKGPGEDLDALSV